MKRKLLVDVNTGNAKTGRCVSYNRLKLAVRKENNRRRGIITMHQVRLNREFAPALGITCLNQTLNN
jgi:hypothetical protein